jgi:demethoxyubiquinone hydroxylase (CLK1/Coq7/Cat5 family)
MDGETFVAELTRENDEILRRLAPAQTLAAESGGDLNPRKLLRIALKNEIEASEIAALWMPAAADVQLKLALARQAGDEAKHYRMIEDRMRQLGDDPSSINPLAEGYTPLFNYLRSLASDVERVAAGQFTREAIALVKNAQFIELCERCGDEATARLYRDVIQPDERFHHEMGAKFLARLAGDAKSQGLARSARARTLELAEELQSLAYRAKSVHHAPGC